jgi:hypothetical protein
MSPCILVQSVAQIKETVDGAEQFAAKACQADAPGTLLLSRFGWAGDAV